MKGCSKISSIKLIGDGSGFEQKLLPSSFFSRDTVKVARELLGCEIVRKVGRKWLRARIVETEAYLEKGDPAAHCAKGPTPRAKIMFEDPGIIYVYFIYGNYFMLNFVTEPHGTAGAALIRAVEPIDGIEFMAERRGARFDELKGKRLFNLTNGPAKLVLALGVDGSLNGKPLGLPHLAVVKGSPVAKDEIVATTRIGISVAQDLPLRFYVKGNPFVSRI